MSSTGRLAVAAPDSIDVFDSASGERVFDRFACEGCNIAALAFSPDGTSFAFTSSKLLPRLALVSAPQ